MASSTAFVKARDVLPVLKGWLRDLDEEQLAAATKERAIAKQDHGQLIAKALVRYGFSINSGVEAVLEAMQKQQEKNGDTIELAVMMTELPPQWSLYRIALQQNARVYFQQHAIESANFMDLYFKSVTFLTLWNDVWMKYVGLPGGRELTVLKGVQQWLLELDKPSAQQAAAEEKAQLWRPPAQALNFNSDDLKTIGEAAEQAIKAQQLQQSETIKDLNAEMEKTFQLHVWLSNAQAEAETAHQVPNKERGGFIIEDAETRPLKILKSKIRQFCEKIYTREHLFAIEWLKELAAKTITQRDAHWAEFDKLFQGSAWRESYEDYVRANLRWMHASRIYAFIQSLIDNELTPSDVKQQAESVAKELTKQHVEKLYNAMGEKQLDYQSAQAALSDEAIYHDTARYGLWILQTLVPWAKDNNKAAIKKYLASNFEDDKKPDDAAPTPIEREINKHSVMQLKNVQFNDPSIFCKAFIMLREEKTKMRQNIDKSVAIGQTDDRDEVAEGAARVCIKIGADLLLLYEAEKEHQQINIQRAISKLPPEPALLPPELFARVLPAVYANVGRRRLLPVFKAIEDREILPALALRPIEKGAPETHIDASKATRMMAMANGASSSSFKEIIHYALWLIWVFHQDAVRNTKIPLTTDPR